LTPVIQPPPDLISPAIEAPVYPVTAPTQTVFDPVSPTIQAFGQTLFADLPGHFRLAVQPLVDNLTPVIHALICKLATPVQSLVDEPATSV